jgi:hypothetical protein
MTYLGYDRGRLTALRRRLDDVADEAAGLRFNDSAAGDASDLYRKAVGLMTAWRTDLDAIASCAFGSPYQPVALDPADPALIDVLRPTDAAWATVSDPRSGIVVSAEDHARHLAEYLVAVDVTSVVGDPRRAAELSGVLTTVTANAASRDTFLATLGADRFGLVVEELARSVAARHSAEEAGRLLAALAGAFGTSYRAGTIDRPVWDTVLADLVDPYATALVLQSAALDAEPLSRLASAAWQRWRRAPNIGIDSVVGPATQTLPLLVAALTTEPVAARRFIATLTEDDLWILFGGIDVLAGTVVPFLLASADPRSGPPEDMEESMVAVLTFLQSLDALTPSEILDGLGAYVGPYMEQLLGPSDGSGYPIQRWSVSEDQGKVLVGWIARNRVSSESLVVITGAMVATRLAQFVAAGPVDGPVLDHLGAIAGRVDRLVADARMDVADEQDDAWDSAWSLLGGKVGAKSGSLLPGLVASTVVSRAVSRGVGSFADTLQEHGWVGAPPDPASVAAEERGAVTSREDERQAAVLAALFTAGRATRTLPSATTPPPAVVPGVDYSTTRTQWRNAATDPADVAARDTLWSAAEAFEAGMGRSENKWSG